ncbi:hypothetical protein LEMLEM_LOCUS6394 [Lemmus lemmus]
MCSEYQPRCCVSGSGDETQGLLQSASSRPLLKRAISYHQ